MVIIIRQHAMHAQHHVVLANLSIHLLHPGIVSKRMHISPNSFHNLIAV